MPRVPHRVTYSKRVFGLAFPKMLLALSVQYELHSSKTVIAVETAGTESFACLDGSPVPALVHFVEFHFDPAVEAPVKSHCS